MKKFALSAVTSLFFSLLASGEAIAASFSFTQIADTTAFSSVSSPSINDNGTVAFGASNNILSGVFTGDGGALTDISISDRPNDSGFTGSPVINNAGTVAYYSIRRNSTLRNEGGTFIRRAGEPITQIGAFPFGESPSINDSETVAFKNADLGQQLEAILTSVVGNDGRRLGFGLINGNIRAFGSLSDPSINNAGTVTFSGTPFTGSRALARGIYTTSSRGGELTPVIVESSSFRGFNNPYINDQDTVAFSSLSDSIAGIFTIDSDRTLSTITDASGPFSSFGNLSLNEQGTVTFEASLDTGGSGIFIGSSPVTDKVIATGDSLFGSSVTSLGFFSGGLNNSTQVAFFAQLADGSTGIFRANPVPVPEPASALGVLAGALCAGSMLKRKQQSRSHHFKF